MVCLDQRIAPPFSPPLSFAFLSPFFLGGGTVGQKVLFVHTGGGISVSGLHDRLNALLPKGQVTPLASKL